MAEMMTQHSTGESAQDRERRTTKLSGNAVLAGVPCRDNDIEPTKGLHSVAILFRIMAGALILLMILQVMSGVTSTIEISYGVLVAEAVRLVIFAGLLWGAGDLAVLFVKSHYDLRASRILLGRINQLMDSRHETIVEPHPGSADAARGPGDGVH